MMRQRLSRSNRARAFLLAMAWACLLLAAPRCLAGEGEKVLEEQVSEDEHRRFVDDCIGKYENLKL